MRIPKTPAKPRVRKSVAKAIQEETPQQSLSQELQDAIRVKAYELYLERNGAEGSPEQDWLTAQKIILSQKA